jgi:hypothetical protein
LQLPGDGLQVVTHKWHMWETEVELAELFPDKQKHAAGLQ